MLKQILNEKIKQQTSLPPVEKVLESKKLSIALGKDPEIEMILPMLADEAEYNDYRFLLKQLKNRNAKAFKKIINLD